MAMNEYLKEPQQRRSRLFELAMVLVVVGVLVFTAARYYQAPIQGSQKSAIVHQAAVFARMVANISAYGKATQSKLFQLNGETIYLNERYYPANADASSSPRIANQTSGECQQLWRAFFNMAPSNELLEAPAASHKDYVISLTEPTVCRYEFTGKTEGHYFFDYDVSTGEVKLTQP